MKWLTSFFRLPLTLENIMTTLNQLTASLVAIQSSLVKARTEILGKIQELQDAITNVSIPAEAEQILADLVEQAQALDNIVPDQVDPTPEETVQE